MRLRIKITMSQARKLLDNIEAGKPIRIKAGDAFKILDATNKQKKKQ